METDHENHELTPIYVCEDDEEAEIIIGYLKANDIDAMIDSNMPHSMLPVENDSRVVVNSDDAEAAKKLLAEREV